MAKLKSNPIQKSDIVEYLDSSSDFSFELSVLQMLRTNDVSCEHGGLYEDPVTGKSREFDIRAKKTISKYRIRLAVECKNIKANFPVVVSCIPRREEESYHQIVRVSEPKPSIPHLNKSRANTYTLQNEYSIYKANEPVGKSTAQVGRGMDSTILVNDGELYDKWSQSLSSATDLVNRTYWDGDENDPDDLYYSAVFPIVVVPNDRLWVVCYDENGNRIQEPYTTNHCSSYIEKDYVMGTSLASTRLIISHIEIMTYDGLFSFVDKYMKTEEGASIIFPNEGIIEAFERKRKKLT